MIPDNDPSSFNGPVFSTQTVDDLLGCDNDDGTLQDVVPIQPRPIVAQVRNGTMATSTPEILTFPLLYFYFSLQAVLVDLSDL